jgi:hypothetical protein
MGRLLDDDARCHLPALPVAPRPLQRPRRRAPPLGGCSRSGPQSRWLVAVALVVGDPSLKWLLDVVDAVLGPEILAMATVDH